MPWVLVDVVLAVVVVLLLGALGLRLLGRVKALQRSLGRLSEVTGQLSEAAARVQPRDAPSPAGDPPWGRAAYRDSTVQRG